MTPGWDPSGVSLGLGREGMEGRGEPGHGLRRGEVMGEGQGMRTGLLPAGGGWEGGKGSVSSASWTPSSEERRNTCGHIYKHISLCTSMEDPGGEHTH